MIKRLTRDIRLIPIVLFATISLLALKISGLVFDGGYTLAERMQGRYRTEAPVAPQARGPENLNTIGEKQAKQSWAQDMFKVDDRGGDITGSSAAAPPPPPGEEKAEASAPAPLKVTDKPPDPTKLEVGGAAIPLEPGRIASPGERAILERLQSRRQELETRNRELEMRENLLKAAEKRLEDKVTELKDTEGRVNLALGTRDKVGTERFKNVVSMYENMKAKDAARIFDRLDLKILVDVTTQMNPRKMSEILAQMSPETAERLTVELTSRPTNQGKPQGLEQLPKIEGKPNGG